jgi:hypothetical protein
MPTESKEKFCRECGKNLINNNGEIVVEVVQIGDNDGTIKCLCGQNYNIHCENNKLTSIEATK